jgi:electron transport complex protein RnfD
MITKSYKAKLTAGDAPHIAEGTRTAAIMWTVSLCLAPTLIWGIAVFGPPALLVVCASLAGAVLTELAVNALRGKVTIGDGSAFLTGLLIGLSLPPGTPVGIPLCAAVFAMAIVKHAFGGLGANWMNPAMAGRVFVMLSFPAAMNGWIRPVTLPVAKDVLAGATPLTAVKTVLAEIGARSAGPEGAASFLRTIGGPGPLLALKHFPVTLFDTQLTAWLNGVFGWQLKPGYFDLFFGNAAGSIGEVSVILLLIGAIVLFFRKIISWEIPTALLGSFALLVWIFGGLPYAAGLFHGDVIFQLFSGGLMLMAFFIATDPVTTPFLRSGKIIFGIGVGCLAFLIRFTGILPEGTAVAVIVMNMFVPAIDRWRLPKRRTVSEESAP